MKKLVSIVSLLMPLIGFSQWSEPEAKERLNSITISKAGHEADTIFTFFFFNSCRVSYEHFKIDERLISVTTNNTVHAVGQENKPLKIPFLDIHGTIQHDYYQRSRIDTPFQQNEFWQHTERIYANAWVKGKYPIRIAVTARQSNSSFFKNFNDLNLQFDRAAYLQRMREQMLARVEQHMKAVPDLKKIGDDLLSKRIQLAQLREKRNSPANLQKIIEEREKELFGVTRSYDLPEGGASAIGSNSPFDFTGRFKFVQKVAPDIKATKLREPEWSDRAIDSMSKIVYSLQTRYDSMQANLRSIRTRITKMINGAKDLTTLSKIPKEAGLTPDSVSRFQNLISHLTQVNVGRSFLDYTELTARNINVTGINIEYQDRYYAAFAAGKIDYRYRDFFNRNSSNSGQYIVLGRLGFRKGENRAFIFTVYQGRKNRSEFAVSDSVRSINPVFGYSVQAIVRKDASTSLSAEFAKSTYPAYGSENKTQQRRALFSFRDRSNNGFHIKGETRIEQTSTRFSGFYRVTGENFQSFSLFGNNSHQTAWQGKVEQEFSKRRILMAAAVRQNDFSNPFAERTYKATTVFKTLQAQIRFPKYPAVSLGYFPGTQLFLIDKERVQESAFYILNGTASYSYQARGTQMNSLFVYNRYITEATDSGFSPYRGMQYSLTQTVYFRKFQVQAGYARTVQPDLIYSSYDVSLDATVKRIFRLGAGLKWTHTAEGFNYWGESMMASVDGLRWGGLRLQYEKAFLPTLRNRMGPVEIGSLSWYKNF